MPSAYPHWESNTQHSYLSFRIPTRQILFFLSASCCATHLALQLLLSCCVQPDQCHNCCLWCWFCARSCCCSFPFWLCEMVLCQTETISWSWLAHYRFTATLSVVLEGFFCQGSSWWFQGFLDRRNPAVRQAVCNYNPPTRSLCVRKTQIEGVICAKTCGLCTNSATRMWKPTAFIWLYQTWDFFLRLYLPNFVLRRPVTFMLTWFKL